MFLPGSSRAIVRLPCAAMGLAAKVLASARRVRPGRLTALLTGLAVLTVASGANFEFFASTTPSYELYEVTRGDTQLTITARGTLQCQRQTL